MTERLGDREKESNGKKETRAVGREREKMFAVDRSVITLPWYWHRRYNHLQKHFQVHLTQLIFIRSIF